MSQTKSKSSQRFHSLNAEQVEVLHQVLSEVVPIHGRGNFPTLELRPRDIIIAVRARLQKQGITVRDVRLNGSTASHVLVQDNGTSYKDLDIIFGVELPSQEEFQVHSLHYFERIMTQVNGIDLRVVVYSSALKVSILLCYPRGLNPLSLGSCNIPLWPCYIAMVMEIFLIFNHIIEPALLFFNISNCISQNLYPKGLT